MSKLSANTLPLVNRWRADFVRFAMSDVAPGLAVSLINLDTGKAVVFDDCRESDGTMIEAKGPGYAEMMQKNSFFIVVFSADWRKQAASQVAASGGRDIEWFFAEPEAAQLAQEVFFDSPRLGRIKVINVPPVAP